jgi:hypothetical protein
MVVDPGVTPTTLSLTATGAVQYTDWDDVAKLAVRLQANTEVKVTSVAISSLGASVTLGQTLIYGDVVLSLTTPAAPGTYDVEVGGELDGASFNKTVQVTLAAPEVDPG